MQRFAAEEQQSQNNQQGHQLGHQRSRQRLIDGFVDDLSDAEFAGSAGALANTVENDYRVVQRIADHRQNRRDRRQIKRHLAEREESDHTDRVMQHRQNRAARELEREAEQYVDQDQHQGREQRPAALDEEFLAHLRTDHFRALQLHAVVDAAEYLENARADLLAFHIRIRWQANQDVARTAE